MAKTTYKPSTIEELLTELRRLEKESNQIVTDLVEEIADDKSAGNLVTHKLRIGGGELLELEILPLTGTTLDAQRAAMRTVLLKGNAPLTYTLIAVLDAAGKVSESEILLYRPDGGAWVRGVVQAAADLRDVIVKVAVAEWEWFGKQTVDVEGVKSAPGKQEGSDEGSERVALYWTEGVNEPGITGKDHNQYWSAAFISYVMVKAGVGGLFKLSDHHQEYIYAAMMAAQEKRESYGYWGARLEDAVPEPGDLICAWRDEKEITFEDAQKPGTYAAHCDLVVAADASTVTVIGGNVDQSVTKRTFKLVGEKVSATQYPNTFAILKNRMSEAAATVIWAQLTDTIAPGQPLTGLTKVEFAPLGENAPIRGIFNITGAQIEKLCTGASARYAKYAAAIAEDGTKYGINPLFVLADFINQGVNEAYRNPWGISTDSYPFGPNGSELGQPNGSVKNGPRKFGEKEWRTAFDRQFAVVAGKKYAKASTIAQWALVDAPPGAANDVHGTNATEGRVVGTIYNKLVGVFKALA